MPHEHLVVPQVRARRSGVALAAVWLTCHPRQVQAACLLLAAPLSSLLRLEALLSTRGAAARLLNWVSPQALNSVARRAT